MEIVIDPHTVQRAAERGANEKEIIEVCETGVPGIAKNNRLSKTKVFPFNKERNGKYYEQKKIEVIFIKEGNIFITVTVYVFYGKWTEL